MKSLFVLTKDGEPFELPSPDPETLARLDFVMGAHSTFAFTSTNKDHVEAMRQVLPDLLDADYGPEAFEIVEYITRHRPI